MAPATNLGAHRNHTAGKLREAIGDQTRSLIVTVPRIGYRLVAEVTVESIDAPLPPRFTFAAGDPVPGRPQWTMELVLGSTGSNDVWLARHAKTGEARVFKFADAPDRLRSCLSTRCASTRRARPQAGMRADPPPAGPRPSARGPPARVDA